MKKNIILFFLLMVALLPALAQKGTTVNITGQVIDTYGDPVIAAIVHVEGTSNAVYTDVEGKYSIDAPADASLTINSGRECIF